MLNALLYEYLNIPNGMNAFAYEGIYCYAELRWLNEMDCALQTKKYNNQRTKTKIERR